MEDGSRSSSVSGKQPTWELASLAIFACSYLYGGGQFSYRWPAQSGEDFVLITKASDAGLVCTGDPSIDGNPLLADGRRPQLGFACRAPDKEP